MLPVQIDFDARLSERSAYRELLTLLRRGLPRSTELSITALASWCLDDPWIHDLPVDEAVRMLFRMGPEGSRVRRYLERGGSFPVPLCRESAGLSLDEPVMRIPRGLRRVYMFSPKRWNPESVALVSFERRGLAVIRPLALLLAFAHVFSPVPAPSCGPFFETPVFEPKDNPPALDDYARGKLGIVLGSYRVSHLVTAWRVLSGKPPEARSVTTRTSEWRTQSAADRWLEARGEVPAANKAPQIHVERRVPGHRFAWFPNCLDSAFDNAASTLHERVKRFGVAHEGVRKWIQAQDAVFANCSEGSSAVDPPEAGLEPLLAADRRYQTASALFYAGEFDKARVLWLEIAKDTNSPWRQWSPYLAARCLVRSATLGKLEDAASGLQKAEAELKAIAASSANTEIRRAAAAIAEWVAAKLRPQQQMPMYARRLEGASYVSRDLDNLLHLWQVVDNSTFRPAGESELLDWLFAMRGWMPFEDTVARWRREKSEVWLVAALQRLEPDSPAASELAAAAARVKPVSPVFATAAWARVRTVSADDNARRTLLDSLLPDLRRSVPAPAINWFLRERLSVARNFTEFVKFAPRRVAAETVNSNEDDSRPPQESRPKILLDSDGEAIVNRFLPLSRWMEILDGLNWTAHLRARLARAGFVRALVAGDEKTALALSARLRATVPATASLLNEHEAASGEARRFAAVWAVLKLPGLQPDVQAGFDRKAEIGRLDPYRDNWWCTPEDSDGKPAVPPRWLSKKELAQAGIERAAAGGVLPFVTPVVVSWMEKNESDPRVPEALAMVIRMSRYTCRDANTGRYSRQAFTLLHRHYPKSRWAKSTPYWYAE